MISFKQMMAQGFGRVLKISLLAFIAVTAFGVYDFTIPYFTEDISDSLMIIGITVSLMYVASFFFEIPLGLAVDRFGRKKVMLASLAGLMGMGLLYFFTEQIWQLMVLGFIFGMIAVAFWIPEAVLIRDYSPKKMYGFSESVYLAISQVGWILGPIIAGIAATQLDLKYNFLLFSALVSIGIIYAWLTLERDNVRGQQRKQAKLFALAKSFKEFIKIHKYALPLYVLSIAVNIWVGIEWVFVQIAGSNVFGLSEGAVGAVLGGMMAVEGLLYLSSGYLMDKVGAKYIMLAGFLLLFSASYFAFLSVNPYMFVFFLLLAGGAVAWIAPGTEALATAIIPVEKRGEMTGVFNSAADIGLMLGPLLGGIFGQFLGGPMVPFIYVAVVAGIAVFISLKLWK